MSHRYISVTLLIALPWYQAPGTRYHIRYEYLYWIVIPVALSVYQIPVELYCSSTVIVYLSMLSMIPYVAYLS